MAFSSYTNLPAITGIGCRLPGGINGPRDLWRALTRGEDAVTAFPPQRWERMASELHPEQRPQEPWSAGTLEDPNVFDSDYFGIGTAEADEMDFQQRILLEVVVEALQNSGMPLSDASGPRTAVYVGAAATDQVARSFAPGQRASMYTAAGAAMAILANRVSYTLDARGPSHTVDTACSSSLVALHQARRDIESGEVDVAIVGGVNILLSAGLTASFVDGGILAPQGRCHSFDADGGGYVRSEGMLALVLKRSDMAQRDNDRVYATVAGSAENSDGRSNGLFAPSRSAQEELLTQAYQRSGVATSEVDYVEAHGTATMVGDLVEASALAAVLGQERETALPVGSVKSNLGHLEGAAGLAGTAKTALALYHGEIPPLIHHEQERPQLRELPVEFPTQMREWPVRGEQRFAGVSAFGFGGTNAHVILTAPHHTPLERDGSSEEPQESMRGQLLPVSAHTETAVRATAAAWASDIENCDLAAAASTAVHRKDHSVHRLAVAAEDTTQAATALRAVAEGHPHPAVRGPRAAPRRVPQTVFVFPGHGAQWKNMGAELYAAEPVFAAAVDRLREAVAAHSDAPWRPGDALSGFADTQRATFTMQVALAELWRSWGVRPDVVVGHSLGEVAAAHVAGALSLDDAARLVCARSELLAEKAPEGGMLATDLTPEAAREAVAGREDELAVAAYNGTRACVLSGTEDALAELHTRLTDEGAWARHVADGVPAHSPLLDSVLPRLRASLAPLAPVESSEARVVSTHTGAPVAGYELDGEYWTRQLRGSVQFAPVVRSLAEEGSAFVEVSPRGVLGHAVSDVLAEAGSSGGVAAAGRPDRDGEAGEYHALLAQAGEVYTLGPVPRGVAPSDLPPAELSPMTWDRAGAERRRAALPDLSAELEAAATEEERVRVVTSALSAIVADVLRREPEQVATTERFEDLGLSSIALMEVRNRVQTAHPELARVTAADLLSHPTIDTFAAHLERHLP